MPSFMMDSFPGTVMMMDFAREGLKRWGAAAGDLLRVSNLGYSMARTSQELSSLTMRTCLPLLRVKNSDIIETLLSCFENHTENLTEAVSQIYQNPLKRFQAQRYGDAAFLEVFTQPPAAQKFTPEIRSSDLILETPGLRVFDISVPGSHRIFNYTVVFAPRAGHHSNIAERAAFFLRSQGLTRMALVEQKCAEEIPLNRKNGRHFEHFEGQVEQYRQVLESLKRLTGHPAHLVAICQPGPLLMATLILYPRLGKTFGSAGSPMHTEAEPGFLTDFARMVGPAYMDGLLRMFGRVVPENREGAGRLVLDGKTQVMGFYFLGMSQHLKNFRRLLEDLRSQKTPSAEKQQAFYQWYHFVHHLPAGFIRDTFEKIFIRNELIHGRLAIENRVIGIKDYPKSVPIWALGGKRDDIAPPLQAVGHMSLLSFVPKRNTYTRICDAGHMGLFRSKKVLQEDYAPIAKFILQHSDTM